MQIDRTVRMAYFGLLSLIFAIVWVGQILGFLGAYTLLLVVPCVLGILVWAVWVNRAKSTLPMFPVDSTGRVSPMMQGILVCVVVAFGLFFGFRLALYPFSSLGRLVVPDLITYHLPKAIELFRSGSMWDLSILYGDYPNGFESLISFALLLTHRVETVGVIQLVIVVLFVLTIYLWLRRFSRFSSVLCAIIALAILFVPFVYSQVLAVGKNDFLLTVLLLGALLHLPMNANSRFNPFPLAMITLVAMCTKANGVVILGVCWLWMMALWGMAFRRGQAQAFLRVRDFALSVLLMVPCTFWVIRNVMVMGRVLSPEVASFSQTSILANITNPNLYNGQTETLLLVLALGITVILGVGSVWATRRWLWVVSMVVCWIAFVLTPLSAFHTPDSTTLHVEWRYTTHLLVLMVLIALSLVDDFAERLFGFLTRTPRRQWGMLLGVVCVIVGLVIAFGVDDLFQLEPAQARIFADPYTEAKGVDGYYSVYDFVQKNIHDSKIWYDVAFHYYLYGEGFTNQPNAGRTYPLGIPEVIPYFVPDYAVVSAIYGDLQNEVLRLGRTYEWEIIYEDSLFIVYQRLN